MHGTAWNRRGSEQPKRYTSTHCWNSSTDNKSIVATDCARGTAVVSTMFMLGLPA